MENHERMFFFSFFFRTKLPVPLFKMSAVKFQRLKISFTSAIIQESWQRTDSTFVYYCRCDAFVFSAYNYDFRYLRWRLAAMCFFSQHSGPGVRRERWKTSVRGIARCILAQRNAFYNFNYLEPFVSIRAARLLLSFTFCVLRSRMKCNVYRDLISVVVENRLRNVLCEKDTGGGGLSNLGLVTYELQLLIKLRVGNTSTRREGFQPYTFCSKQWCSGYEFLLLAR